MLCFFCKTRTDGIEWWKKNNIHETRKKLTLTLLSLHGTFNCSWSNDSKATSDNRFFLCSILCLFILYGMLCVMFANTRIQHGYVRLSKCGENEMMLTNRTTTTMLMFSFFSRNQDEENDVARFLFPFFLCKKTLFFMRVLSLSFTLFIIGCRCLLIVFFRLPSFNSIGCSSFHSIAFHFTVCVFFYLIQVYTYAFFAFIHLCIY